MSPFSRSKQAIGHVRTFVRNSPWISIAVLLHVLLIAIFSVVYVASKPVERELPATAIAYRPADPALLPPEITEPPAIDRGNVPLLAPQDSNVINPSEFIVQDALAGRHGEISDATDPTLEPGQISANPEPIPGLTSGETGGTVIGVGNLGHRGAGTSPWSTRRLGPGGPGGKDGLGQNGHDGPGGPRKPEDTAVISALRWLKEHQSADGRWDADGFMENCKKNTCSGPGYSSHDPGVTGLALLCFLGAGFTNIDGPYRETVKNGLKYLMSIQDEEGCYGERVGHQFLYDHACAALAMSEAAGMTEITQFRTSAQKAVNFILRAQNPYRAWRYAYPPDGDNDTSVTGWMVMVLKSAKMSHLTIDEAAYQGAINWIEETTDPATGRTGYTDFGGRPSRLTEVMNKYPAELSESMTAVGVLCRIFAGHTLENDKMIAAGAALISAQPPVWDVERGSIDFYYWYYATLAMFQFGGSRWERWNDALRSSALAHQRNNPGEDEFGSWDPIDAWSGVGGRIYSTTLNCLCMEVSYRYPRFFGQKR